MILVPQAGLSRDATGHANVFVVGPDNKVVEKTVTATRIVGPNWVVTAGMNPGDHIIMQGTANLKQGVPVRPVPYDTPQKIVGPLAKSG